jgi:hypothetical protein
MSSSVVNSPADGLTARDSAASIESRVSSLSAERSTVTRR